MTTPRIEEIVEELWNKIPSNELDEEEVYFGYKNTLRQALTQAHQAGIDEAVEIVKKQRNTDSCIGIGGLHHAEEKRIYNQALDDIIKALQDNKS